MKIATTCDPGRGSPDSPLSASALLQLARKGTTVSLNPVMLLVRFLLELAALGCFATYGWRNFEGPMRFVAAIALPLIAAALWGTFAVPGDPSRNGEAAVAVPGVVRLALELAVLLGGALALWLANLPRLSLGFAAIVLIYLVLSFDRFGWLLKH